MSHLAKVRLVSDLPRMGGMDVALASDAPWCFPDTCSIEFMRLSRRAVKSDLIRYRIYIGKFQRRNYIVNCYYLHNIQDSNRT